jgi:predicted nucleic acid-binding protein
MRTRPEPPVFGWLAKYQDACFLSVITVGEVERGIQLLPNGQKKQRLRTAFEQFVEIVEERILAFDRPVAHRWALLTTSKRKGRRLPVLDSMIEATALHWDLTIVTRSTSDFVQARTLNPWLSA